MQRINVSLDTLDPEKFKAITRWGDFAKVMARHPRRAGRGPCDQAQRRRAEGRQRGRDPRDDPLRAWRRHGPDADRDHADGRHRRRPHRPVSAAVAGARAACRSASRSKTSTTGPAARRATCASRRPAGGSASSRRSRIISARAATACASPAPARSSCASARTTPRTSARRFAPRKATSFSRRAIDEAISRKPKGHDFVIDRRTKAPAVSAAHERHRRLTTAGFI